MDDQHFSTLTQVEPEKKQRALIEHFPDLFPGALASMLLQNAATASTSGLATPTGLVMNQSIGGGASKSKDQVEQNLRNLLKK